MDRCDWDIDSVPPDSAIDKTLVKEPHVASCNWFG